MSLQDQVTAMLESKTASAVKDQYSTASNKSSKMVDAAVVR